MVTVKGFCRRLPKLRSCVPPECLDYAGVHMGAFCKGPRRLVAVPRPASRKKLRPLSWRQDPAANMSRFFKRVGKTRYKFQFQGESHSRRAGGLRKGALSRHYNVEESGLQ